jgi:Ca2+-binding EF-hand superfamily protein
LSFFSHAYFSFVSSPHVLLFREQLKRAFNVTLTVLELEALFEYLAKDEEGEAILCANFLVQFFRLGFQERSIKLQERSKEKRRVEKLQERKKLEEMEELERKGEMQCSYIFTTEEKERALMKLREAARLYDKTTPGALSMKSFEVAYMPPYVFKDQLRRIFNLKLTPPELGALMTIFDTDRDGNVTCEEFSKTFLAMGFKERERELKLQFKRQREAEETRKAEQTRREELLAAKNAKKYTFEYTERDIESAMSKITEAAWKFDKNMPGAPNLVAFDKQMMEPHDFKEQLRRAFNINIAPAELGALLTYFNADEEGLITCAQFLIKFFKLGFQERSRRRAQWIEHEKKIQETRKEEEMKKKVEAEKKLVIDVVDFTEADFQSAFAKLTSAAIKYEKSSYGADSLAAFEAESMPPHVFREQLKIALNVRLSVGELGALMSYFDKEDKGAITCKEFLIEFFRTGVEERDRIRFSWRNEQSEREKRASQEKEEREKEALLKASSEVNYEFNEVDFDAALAKLVHLCRHFDTRQLGASGLSGFAVDTLTPSEFREMLRKTFSLKLPPPQLGALVTFFDPTVKGIVSCTTFLNTFVKIRVKCEAFKVLSSSIHPYIYTR